MVFKGNISGSGLEATAAFNYNIDTIRDIGAFLANERDLMSSKEAQELERSIARMRKICKVIRVLCLVCLISFSLVWIVFVCLLMHNAVTNQTTSIGLIDIATLLVFGTFVCLLLVIAFRAFSDIVSGESPFTFKQVKRLRLLGAILLAYTAAEILLSAVPIAFSSGVEVFGLPFVIAGAGSTDSPTIDVNALALIMSAMCFGFSVIFKYGVLLQQQSDDTL